MTAPTYITIQLRRPREDDPGLVDEAWFVVDGDRVSAHRSRRRSAAWGRQQAQLRPNETAREGAARLLRARSRSRPARPFNRALRYPKLKY